MKLLNLLKIVARIVIETTIMVIIEFIRRNNPKAY